MVSQLKSVQGIPLPPDLVLSEGLPTINQLSNLSQDYAIICPLAKYNEFYKLCFKAKSKAQIITVYGIDGFAIRKKNWLPKGEAQGIRG